MKRSLSNPLLNDKFIGWLIIINAVIITYLSFGNNQPFYKLFTRIDIFLTLIFVVEIVCKISHHKKQFFKSAWNRFDASFVLLSFIPLVLIIFQIDEADFLAKATMLRTFRLFKLPRIIQIIPNADKISKDLKRAFKATYGIFIAGFILLIIIGVTLSSIFGDIYEDRFGDPFVSIYSLFIIFTAEDWYGFSDTIKYGQMFWIKNVIRLLFSLLALGGMFFFGFIISSISDELAMDNNDQVITRTKELEEKIDGLNEKIDLLIKQKE